MNKILPVQLSQTAQPLHAATNAVPRADESGSADPLLELNSFGVTFGNNPALSELSFTVPEKGTVLLVGPKGTERTTLLRTLAGHGVTSGSLKLLGKAFYRGAALGTHEHPALVVKNAQLMMATVLENVLVRLPRRDQLTQSSKKELAQQFLIDADLADICDRLDEKVMNLPLVLQRHLSVLREVVAEPPLLCIDEPTSGLTDVEAARLIAYLRKVSQKRALLISMCDQVHARLLGGKAVFMAYGRMLEQQPIPQIFDQPQTLAAQEFAKSGKCSLVSYEASLKNQGAAHPGETGTIEIQAFQKSNPVETAAPEPEMEVGKFMWLKRGMLAGTPAPGRQIDVDTDLSALREQGVTVLMTLTESGLDEATLGAFGLKQVLEPIPESGAPDMAQGIRICKTLESLLKQGEVIAVQGECGLGRTGTILAAHLLWKGIQLNDAVEYLRRVEPRWVQTQAQLDFLSKFAQRV